MSAVSPGAWSTPIGIADQSATRQRLSAITYSPQLMRHTDQPSLPAWIQTAYEALAEAYTSDTDELSRAAAQEVLLAEAEHIEDNGDATYALDRLLDRGWLYEVDGQLRKTQ